MKMMKKIKGMEIMMRKRYRYRNKEGEKKRGEEGEKREGRREKREEAPLITFYPATAFNCPGISSKLMFVNHLNIRFTLISLLPALAMDMKFHFFSVLESHLIP